LTGDGPSLNQGFPRQARITKTDDFSSVFSFRRRIYGDYMVFHYRKSVSGGARLGLVISKKIAKRSVDRNYMRRVLRELFRKQRSCLLPIDLVIRATKVFHRSDFKDVEREFSELMAKLERAMTKRDKTDFQEHRSA
jgi:ribonuclease P protein component